MKFVCNNCGFTADIPERMSACPMCGSSNVSSSSAETSDFPTETAKDKDENAKSQNFKAAEGPTQRVTLTEGMFENQPETLVEKPSEKQVKKSCGKKAAFVIVTLFFLAVAAAAAYYFFFFK